MGSFSIRPYRYRIDDDAVSPMMPEAAQPWGWARSFLAEKEDGEVIGAACLALHGAENPRVKIQCRAPGQKGVQENAHAVEVRQALLAEVTSIAQKMRWPAVWAWNVCDENSEELAAWVALGFKTDAITPVYEVRVDDYMATTDPFYRRLRDRGKLDRPYRVERLNDANAHAAAALRASAIGGSVDDALFLMGDTATTGKFDHGLSSVLMIDDQVAAIFLVQLLAEGLVMVDSVAVDPVWRNGWANVVLRTEANRWLIENGIPLARFAADPKHSDGHKAARRSGAKIVERRIRPYLRIGAQ